MKILLLDIETAPHLAMVWGIWDQNIALDQIQKPGYTLCWSAKWLGSKDVHFASIKHDGKTKMLKRIHKLLDEADAVIHFNGTKFDIPTLQGEFLIAEMKPPAPFKQIDLLTVVKKQFRFPSNKLDYVLRALGLGQKVRHRGMQMWIECMQGIEAAWKEMKAYNIGDIEGLEKLYWRILPWVQRHPNHGVFTDFDTPLCSNCGSAHVQRRGYARTTVGVYARFCCMACGAWSRNAVSEQPRGTQRSILRPIEVS